MYVCMYLPTTFLYRSDLELDCLQLVLGCFVLIDVSTGMQLVNALWLG